MLPSRLYRNVGIPPPLRSLLLPHPTLPPTIRAQLLFRPGVSSALSLRNSLAYSTTPLNSTNNHADTISAPAPSSSESANSSETVTSQALPDKIEPRMSITFTCTVPDCGTRSTHEFAKRSYERGIVIVECPGCHNRHLIADHLGWFNTEESKTRTVEDILQARGEKVRRGHRDETGGVVEYTPE